jgi:bacterioferritin-associated ferredoxin
VIICLCEGISDRDVSAAARQGVRTVKELTKICDAGTGCGSCRWDIRKILDDHSPSETSSSHDQDRCGAAKG